MFKVIRSDSISDLAAVLQSFEESIDVQGFSFSVENRTKWDDNHQPRQVPSYVCLVQYRNLLNFGSEISVEKSVDYSVEKPVGCDEPDTGWQDRWDTSVKLI